MHSPPFVYFPFLYCTLNRLQYSINLSLLCSGTPKNSFGSVFVTFTWLRWSGTKTAVSLRYSCLSLDTTHAEEHRKTHASSLPSRGLMGAGKKDCWEKREWKSWAALKEGNSHIYTIWLFFYMAIGFWRYLMNSIYFFYKVKTQISSRI